MLKISGISLKSREILYYMNSRYMDPTVGIYISPDPSMSGLNHYAYCSSNPITYTDPTGMWDDDSCYDDYSYYEDYDYWCWRDSNYDDHGDWNDRGHSNNDLDNYDYEKYDYRNQKDDDAFVHSKDSDTIHYFDNQKYYNESPSADRATQGVLQNHLGGNGFCCGYSEEVKFEYSCNIHVYTMYEEDFLEELSNTYMDVFTDNKGNHGLVPVFDKSTGWVNITEDNFELMYANYLGVNIADMQTNNNYRLGDYNIKIPAVYGQNGPYTTLISPERTDTLHHCVMQKDSSGFYNVFFDPLGKNSPYPVKGFTPAKDYLPAKYTIP